MGLVGTADREPLPAFGRRTVLRTKADVAAAVCAGVITPADAAARYGLTPDELLAYQDALKLLKLEPSGDPQEGSPKKPLDAMALTTELNRLE